MAEYDWEGIAARHEFRELLIAKARFIVPATLFFIIYYFALPISVGYFPEFMSRKVFGQVNIAYLFALSQFFMAWTIAALYIRAAVRFDAQAHFLVGHLDGLTPLHKHKAGLKREPRRRAGARK